MSSAKSVSNRIADPLKRFIAEESAVEQYIDRMELYRLFLVIERIAELGEAFLVTYDPYDDYNIVNVKLADVVKKICRMLYEPGDVRVFGDDWAVGVSSYSSNQHDDPGHKLSIEELEVKLTLIGTATSWIANCNKR